MAGVKKALALVLSFEVLARAATVHHDFNVTWVTAAPDGFERPVIGINGEWPVPRIDVNKGDRVTINVNNQLGNQTTSLHFHGLYLEGQVHMDGPMQVTQCTIPPGGSFLYNFTINQPGTYWWHSHSMSQYPDGIRGALVVHDPDFPFKDEYDEEIVMTFSDWYHDGMQEMLKGFISKGNPTGAEPVPDSALMNDTQDLQVHVKPNKTYFFRLINIGAFASQYIWFEGHDINIVEVDGVYTKKAKASMIYLSVAQRCSFFLTTKNDTSENFAIVGSMDTTLFDAFSPDLNYNVTGWLVYDDDEPLPKAKFVDEYEPFDDMDLVPHDEMERLDEPDQIVELDVIMDNLGDGANYAFFNNITYVAPKVPTLYTALSAGDDAENPQIYGEYTHPFVLKKDEIVQIRLNNLDAGRHPFHLHGHAFQALYRGPEESGTFEHSHVKEEDLPKMPMRRDTLVVWPDSNFIIRFKADNPGIWLFHCHIEWHLSSGLIATMIEGPKELQKLITVPKDHLETCAMSDIAVEGNAAGNKKDFMDLSGQNKPADRLPDGFTPRGIVALVFSIIAGVIGVIVVAWFGMSSPEGGSNRSRDATMLSPSESSASGNVPGEEVHATSKATRPVSGASS